MSKEKNIFSSKIMFSTVRSKKKDFNNNSREQGPSQYRPLIYHGGISRRLAEDVLQCQVKGSFLIRDSQSEISGRSLVLSVRSDEGYLHLKIERHSGKFVLGGRGPNTPQFEDISSIVRHYTRHNIRLRGGGRIKLYQPALERLL